jgi:hypothetical protein
MSSVLALLRAIHGALPRSVPWTLKEQAMAGPDYRQAAEQEQQPAAVDVDPHLTRRPVFGHPEVNASHQQVNELPPLGYPIGEESVMRWFEYTYNRAPETAEVGIILDAMARREAEQPPTELPSDRVFLDR